MVIKPYRACDAELQYIRFPTYVQPKIDGVRGLNFGLGLTARTLKKFKNKALTAAFSPDFFLGLDGELTVHPDPTHPTQCSDTTSNVNTILGHDRMYWWLFDYVTPDTLYKPYSVRLTNLHARLDYMFDVIPDLRKRLIVVPNELVQSQEELDLAIQRHLNAGYEGTVVRSPTGYHKEGYCTAREAGFVRIKEFKDAEATIIGLNPVEHNANLATINLLGQTERSSHQENKIAMPMVGAFLCLTPEGQTITVSAGSLPHALKEHYWHNQHEVLGKVLTYKYFPKGMKKLPRFPTLKFNSAAPAATFYSEFKLFRAGEEL